MAIRVNKAGELRTDYHIIYDRLQPILAALEGKDDVIMISKGFMDLNVDRLYSEKDGFRIALAHYYKQNGDMVPDPDMEIRVYPDRKMAEALTFQNALFYQEVYFTNDSGQAMVRPKLKKQLNDFLKMWLRNLKQQGFFK